MSYEDIKDEETPEEEDESEETGEERFGSDSGEESEYSDNAERISRGAFDSMAERSRLVKLRNNILIAVVAVITCIVFGVSCVALFFRITDISVEGMTRYDSQDVISALPFAEGDNLYSMDKDRTKQAISEKCPYLGYISIKRKIPDTVIITIAEEEPKYYFSLGGEYFVLSESLRILERTSSMAEILLDYKDIIKINTNSIKRAVVGEPVVFENEGYYSYAQEMLSTFLNSAIRDRITLIDFSNRFFIFVIYDDRLKIEFGDIDNMDVKLAFALGIIDKLSYKDEGIINVENDTGFYKIATIKGTY